MSRVTRVLGPALLVLVGLVTLLIGLDIGGGAKAPLLQDPGAGVRYGLPVARMLADVTIGGMIGALVLCCFVLSPKEREYTAALDIAAGFAAVATVASGATGYLHFADVTAMTPADGIAFTQALTTFLTTVPLGIAWLTTTIICAATTVLAFAVRDIRALLFVTVFALLALLPLAQQGHAAGAAGHNQAVNSLGLHLVFVSIWLGGLLTVLFLRPSLEKGRLAPVLVRYSTLALVSFVVVAVSGVANAQLRVGTPAQLLTPYGVLVITKAAALIGLGIFGAVQRRFLIVKIVRGAKRAFWWFIVAELAFMGIAMGTAAALGRTATPVKQELGARPTPAELLTGDKLPPEPRFADWFTQFNIDLLWLLACAFGVFFYLAAVWRLRRRGDKWPIGRTISWCAGLLALFYFTNGGVNVWERYLFSTHMLGHMALTMLVPLLLVPGAPVTLASRAIHKRQDGSWGPREWILWAVHTPYANFITRPLVAALIFAGSLWAFYYTPLLAWAMKDHIGHEWMIAHFLIGGYLFVQSLIGIDPVKHRLGFPLRVALLLGTMAFHAFFGLTMMMSTRLLAADWFGAMGRVWGADPLSDQQVGGGIAWSIGELPTFALAIVVAVQWSMADAKETKRLDRNADRTNDAELRAYNERLAAMAAHDRGEN